MTQSSPPDAQQDHHAEGDVTEEAVAAFLAAHPDFFERHLSLLDTLRVPHETKGAVSLIERQVSLLRESNRQLERKLLDLVQVARENEGLSTRLHRLAIGLMEADSVEDALATARELLRDEFHSTHVVIRLFDGDDGQGSQSRDLSIFDDLFESGRPVCGRHSEAQLKYLFEDQASEVKSAVMIPMADGQRLGILALGSPEADRFHPGMGTLFLGYLGGIIGAAIQSLLKETCDV